MVVDFEEQIKKFETQKKKILLKERLLKEKAEQRKFKRIAELVEVAFSDKFNQIEDAVLLGAFLEISEKIQDPSAVMRWQHMGELHLKKKQDNTKPLLAITFSKQPEKDMRDLLKKMKFRWNPFRKEFCGYGNQRELESMLQPSKFSIEIIQ